MDIQECKAGFILQVKVTVDPARVDSFLQHFKTCYDHVLAEPECVFFVVGQSTTEPGVFQWTEGWTQDPEWFQNVQLKKAYYEPYLEAVEPLFVTPRAFAFYKMEPGMGNFKLGQT